MFGCAIHCYCQVAILCLEILCLEKVCCSRRVLYVSSNNIITAVFYVIALDFGNFNLEKALLGNESQGFALCGDREGRGVAVTFPRPGASQAPGPGLLSLPLGCSRSSFQPVPEPTQIINCTATTLQEKQFFGFSKNQGISLRKLLNLPFCHKPSSK